MGKNDFLTPNAIANRIKEKGLQKLRWYCQMCQKQCRDENRFVIVLARATNGKCKSSVKTLTESSTATLKNSKTNSLTRENGAVGFLVSLRPWFIMNTFMIGIHMNSTQWATMTEFDKYLGRTGKCRVEETPKGWFITYIDRDPETIFMENMKNKPSFSCFFYGYVILLSLLSLFEILIWKFPVKFLFFCCP